MITIDDMIFLNQMSQKDSDRNTEQEWFLRQSPSRQVALTEWLAQMISQAGGTKSDAEAATQNVAVKASLTPCVLLTTGELRLQLKRVSKLNHPDFSIAFCLMLEIFRSANSRRIQQHPENIERHWWNWKLDDPAVIARVRSLYEAGDL